MKNIKYFFLLFFAHCLISASVVFAGGPPEGWCDDCCASEYGAKGQCTGCTCGGSGGSGDVPVPPKPLPEDERGTYYIDVSGKREYIQYRSWNDCMNMFGDAGKCSRIVLDPCQSCMGLCQAVGGNACRETCKNSCANSSYEGTSGNEKNTGGTDDYGTWYLEGGQKKYSNFNDFRGCWSVMADVKECIKYGYYCGYKNGFYISNLCHWNDNECIDRVRSEYDAACAVWK